MHEKSKKIGSSEFHWVTFVFLRLACQGYQTELQDDQTLFLLRRR